MSWTIVYLVRLVLCLTPGSVIIASSQGQITNTKVLERGDDWRCPSVEDREKARNEIHQIVASVIATTTPLTTMPTVLAETTTSAMSTTTTFPATTTASTTTVPPTTTSATTMPTVTGCSGPGWRRVAFVNMTDTSYNCPTGLNLTLYSKRTCGRSHTTYGGCSSTTFSVGGLLYSRVCGRIRAYQFGTTSAFWLYTRGIESYYVDGVSLTHGAAGRRQHIWTFAAGLTEVNNTGSLVHKCPCDISRNYDRVPAFVGNDYFCESGLHSDWRYPDSVQFYLSDVLWDGKNCTSTSTCCQLNNPPWFTKNLPSATTDDIELRICTSGIPVDEDIPIELIELYVL